MERIKIGISSCLLGEKVRYNGEHKLNTVLKDALHKYNIEYIPVCPEVECGLGVPRKSMHLEGNPTDPRLIITDTGEDITDRMVKWAQKQIIQLEKEDICGFIFKSDSPSCGIKTVNVFNRNSLPSKTGTGLFTAIFIKRFPLLPTEDEENLKNPALLENFIERICDFAKSCAKQYPF
jgi:uncharacterized protein YbbK (DUF523 family)